MVPTKLINIGADESPTLPGFSAFSAHVGHDRKADSVVYLPLIPSSPTNASEGYWADYLTEATNMIPYIVAAGHHKYGLYLPL